MRSLSRRFGIAALSLTLVATLFGTSQAGIIPWVYDAIFGPVGGYGPYPYAGPYRPMPMGYGCNPCMPRTTMRCAPSPCSPCSSGSCPTFVSYGVRSACEAGVETTQWKAGAGRTAPDAETAESGAGDINKLTPAPADPAPTPTFVAEEEAEESVNKPDAAAVTENESEAAREAASESTEVTPGDLTQNIPVGGSDPEAATETTPAAPVGGGFEFRASTSEEKATEEDESPAATTEEFPFPRPGVETEEERGEAAPTLPVLPESLREAADLDGQASWKPTVSTRRLAKRTSHGKAWLARRTVPVKAGYVIPSDTIARILSETRVATRD